MSDDLQTYHHKFSVEAYNRAADILFARAPSQDDIEGLIELVHVSHSRTGALPSGFGYAHEALARAYLCLGEREQARSHLDEARRISETVPNAQAKTYLLDQIDRIDLS
jgi:hypothetical protein